MYEKMRAASNLMQSKIPSYKQLKDSG